MNDTTIAQPEPEVEEVEEPITLNPGQAYAMPDTAPAETVETEENNTQDTSVTGDTEEPSETLDSGTSAETTLPSADNPFVAPSVPAFIESHPETPTQESGEADEEKPELAGLELNKEAHFIFGIDASSAMIKTDCPGDVKRIDFLKLKVVQFAHEVTWHDDNGIDVITFGPRINHFNRVSTRNAPDIIGTITADPFDSSANVAALIGKAKQLHDETDKQTVLFIATGNAPSDPETVIQAIVDIADSLEDAQEFTIIFLTVGEVGNALAKFLIELGEGLNTAKHKIADVRALQDVDFSSVFAEPVGN